MHPRVFFHSWMHGISYEHPRVEEHASNGVSDVAHAHQREKEAEEPHAPGSDHWNHNYYRVKNILISPHVRYDM